MGISRTELYLSVTILILAGLLIFMLTHRPDTSGLKQHILQLANRNLGYLPKPQPYSAPNYGVIPYSAGTDGPLRFYTGVERIYSDRWQKVGIVFSESKTDDTVFELWQRLIPPFDRDSFEYRVRDTYKNLDIPLPSQNGRMLHNGDRFLVPGKESIGKFVVARDTDYMRIPI